MALQKRGVEMSIQTIVYAVLALIVLIVVLMIFSSQIRTTILGYISISNRSLGEVNGENCGSLFGSDRKCYQGGCPADYTPVDGEWKDCTTGVCCEKKSI